MWPLVIDGVSVASDRRWSARLVDQRSRSMRRGSTCGDELTKAGTLYRSSPPTVPRHVFSEGTPSHGGASVHARRPPRRGPQQGDSIRPRSRTEDRGLAMTIRADLRQPSAHHSSNDARSVRASSRSSLSPVSRRSVSYHAKTCSSEIKLAG